MSYFSGKTRLKKIRAAAREGPRYCFNLWRDRHRRLLSITARGAPASLIAHFRSLEHDMAVAVRWSRPGDRFVQIDLPGSPFCRGLRKKMAEMGFEHTPQDVPRVARRTLMWFRRTCEFDGVPIPVDDNSLIELIRASGILEAVQR